MLREKKVWCRVWCSVITFLLCINLFVGNVCTYAEEQAVNVEGISSEAAILMESSTGTVIYEKDADKQLPPASITKIMTLLLIFDAIDSGKISLDEIVTVSEYAASMGGSQVFLEPMEQQTVDTMIKCISVASANDACASYIYSRAVFRDSGRRKHHKGVPICL